MVLGLFIICFTGLPVYLAGIGLILSVLFYTFSWILYVWGDRRSFSMLIRETRGLRSELVQKGITSTGGPEANQEIIADGFERLETGLRSTLDEYQESYRRELKVQSFNSHLAVQEVKSLIFAERDHDEQ